MKRSRWLCMVWLRLGLAVRVAPGVEPRPWGRVENHDTLADEARGGLVPWGEKVLKLIMLPDLYSPVLPHHAWRASECTGRKNDHAADRAN